MSIKYSKLSGYKYRLEEDYTTSVSFYPVKPIHHKFFGLSQEGWLLIRTGYCWDGPSGPAIDTKDFITPSLVHDVLYQLMRLDYFDHKIYRIRADKRLYSDCIKRGMPSWRAWYVYTAVRWFAGKCAMPATVPEPVILTAP